MFHKVEINIPLLDAIKQIPKYAKFLKELCVHKRKKMMGSVEVGGKVSTLTRNENFTIGAQSLLKKCQDPRMFQSHASLANDETSGKDSTLILERQFLMIAKTKIDVHVRTLSMEFGDTLVQFNIFEAMKHPIEDHSLFGIDLIDELVEE
ncbi:hypothetical protein CR513_49447, partial [Mucuna pruriens]